MESGTEAAPAVCGHLVPGLLRTVGVDYRQKDRAMGRGGNWLDALWRNGPGRIFIPTIDSAGVCGLDSDHLSHRMGGVSSASGRYFLSFVFADRADFANDGTRPPPAEVTPRSFYVEGPGWQSRPGQLPSTKLMNQKRRSDFEKQAAKAGGGFFQEFWIFLKENKKWWLLPILLAFLLMGVLLLAGGTGAAPFIYTLF